MRSASCDLVTLLAGKTYAVPTEFSLPRDGLVLKGRASLVHDDVRTVARVIIQYCWAERDNNPLIVLHMQYLTHSLCPFSSS